MGKLILTAVISVFSANTCVGAVSTAYGSQTANVFASAVSDAGFVKDLNSIAVTAVENIKADKAASIMPAKAVPQKAGAYVRVSGRVSLTGTVYIPQDGGFASVNMTGWAAFRDNTGKITSNNTRVNVMASMWIYPDQYVSQTVRPNISVQLYRDGKYVGSANMTGGISVGGWPSGGFVCLTGNGYLTGDVYVEDAK